MAGLCAPTGWACACGDSGGISGTVVGTAPQIASRHVPDELLPGPETLGGGEHLGAPPAWEPAKLIMLNCCRR